MRLRVSLTATKNCTVPVSPQEALTAVVYSLLDTSDAEYARFLHEEGYALEGSPKRFKFFTFSGLRVPAARRRIDSAAGQLHLSPGPFEWLISSPVEPFLRHLATGLLSSGSLRVGSAIFPITQVDALPTPAFSDPMRFTCLSPIVLARFLPEGGTHYLRPAEGAAFSEALRANLLGKHRLLHGKPPADDRFALTFDPAYLERTAGTKLITFKNIQIVGAFAPFTVTGSPELMQVMWDCGAGEKCSTGFGMVEGK